MKTPARFVAITVSEVQNVAYELARQLLSFDEPIPHFSTRFPNALESCLAAPFQRYNKKYLYPNFTTRAAVLFYLLVKNHPFQNGNKRIAVMTLMYFLYKNKKWLVVDSREFYNFAVWVAESNPRLKDETILAAEKFIRTYLVKSPRFSRN